MFSIDNVIWRVIYANPSLFFILFNEITFIITLCLLYNKYSVLYTLRIKYDLKIIKVKVIFRSRCFFHGISSFHEVKD